MGRGTRNKQKADISVSRRTGTNRENIEIYSRNHQTYIDKTYVDLAPEEKAWVQVATEGLPANDQTLIYEVGAGEGRTSRYLEELGFYPTVSDAVYEFVDILNKDGRKKPAVILDCLNQNIDPAQDLIIANAVLLHFTDKEIEEVFRRFYSSLKPEGKLAFSVKTKEKLLAEGEDPLGSRYFNSWSKKELVDMLGKNGFGNTRFIGETENMLRCITQKSTS